MVAVVTAAPQAIAHWTAVFVDCVTVPFKLDKQSVNEPLEARGDEVRILTIFTSAPRSVDCVTAGEMPCVLVRGCSCCC
jgi:hypothetical protein